MSAEKPREIKTNLEKKTREKITKMSDDVSTIDFVLKNIKLLKRVRRCRVRIGKIRNNKLLYKKHASTGKSKAKADKNSKKERETNPVGEIVDESDTETVDEPEINQSRRKSKQTEKSANNTTTHLKQSPPKSESPDGKKIAQKRKRNDQSSESNKRKDVKKKQQIFIHLPFLENAKLRSINKELSERNTMKKRNAKKRPAVKKLGKTYLTEKFGGRFFRCYVKVPRYRDPNDPTPKKREKNNRKSVSFVETVEVFGESDEEASPGISNTSTPAQKTNSAVSIESTDSETCVSPSPKKRKISSLKSNESPRSDRMRKSDEKIPRKRIDEENDQDNSKLNEDEDVIAIENSDGETSTSKTARKRKSLSLGSDTNRRSTRIRKSSEAKEQDRVVTIESSDSEISFTETSTKRRVLPARNDKTRRSTRTRKSTENLPPKQVDKDKDENSSELNKDLDTSIVPDSINGNSTEADKNDLSKRTDDEKEQNLEEESMQVSRNENAQKSKETSQNSDEESEGKSKEENSEKSVEDHEKKSDKENVIVECENDDEGSKSGDEDKESEEKTEKNADENEEKSEFNDENEKKSKSDDENEEEAESNAKDYDEKVSKSDDENEEKAESDVEDNSTSSHTETPSTSKNRTDDNSKVAKNSKTNENNKSDNDDDLFSDAEEMFDKQEAQYTLQVSNTSEISSTCEKTAEKKCSETNLTENNTGVVQKDESHSKQTRFSLNTFFKSLKTKIISEPSESSPTKNGKQHTEDGDNSLRDELTIK